MNPTQSLKERERERTQRNQIMYVLTIRINSRDCKQFINFVHGEKLAICRASDEERGGEVTLATRFLVRRCIILLQPAMSATPTSSPMSIPEMRPISPQKLGSLLASSLLPREALIRGARGDVARQCRRRGRRRRRRGQCGWLAGLLEQVDRFG